MSRRPASCFPAAIVASAVVLLLAGCGGGEAPAPPAGVAKAPIENPQPAGAPAPASAAPPQQQPAAALGAAPAAEAPPAANPPAESPAPAAGSDAKPAEKPAEKPVDALQWMQDAENRRADYQRRISESEANLAIANASVADWERTLLEFKNPFLARPKLSPEDAETVKGMDGRQRVEWAQGRLETARTSRDALQKNLDDLKANPPLR